MNKQRVTEILDTPKTFNTAAVELKRALWNYDSFNPVEVASNLSADERLVINRGLENILAPLYKERRKVVYEAAVNLVNYYEQNDGNA